MQRVAKMLRCPETLFKSKQNFDVLTPPKRCVSRTTPPNDVSSGLRIKLIRGSLNCPQENNHNCFKEIITNLKKKGFTFFGYNLNFFPQLIQELKS